MMATAVQSDSIWLRATKYNVAALNSKLAGRVSELRYALEAGLPAYPDTNRGDFYDVELPNGWPNPCARGQTYRLFDCLLASAERERGRKARGYAHVVADFKRAFYWVKVITIPT